ncbi:PREDICTED: hemoglobin subunit zeta-like [Bison bison bison]|uniref:Hemoglobin subunit zeta n=1 Tax=Bison bison bison TaxID=43346 RepID=A0A6P3IXC5_BISBB|nr:PREDICTED: hemoglobin subunit zeta-like [Bison bison bison]
MSLTRAERTIIVSMWSKISTQADLIGTETLERLFSCYPQAKTYFPHFDLHTGSAQLRAHGSRVVAAALPRFSPAFRTAGPCPGPSFWGLKVAVPGWGPAARTERTIIVSLWSKISTQADVIGTKTLESTQVPTITWTEGGREGRNDLETGGQGEFLSHCLLVTLASHFPADFTADVHAAWDKFLSIVSGDLTEKYR